MKLKLECYSNRASTSVVAGRERDLGADGCALAGSGFDGKAASAQPQTLLFFGVQDVTSCFDKALKLRFIIDSLAERLASEPVG